nr:reverse transcriptase domain-containing protein [Tanacetum cinerariifolium]
MAPKRARTTKTNPDPTRTTTATEPMIQEAINNLIAQRVTEALSEYETHRNSVVNGDTSHTTGTGPRTVRPTRECTYKDYMNCGPLKFNGTEGVIEVSYAMPWKTLRQMMTVKYCPRGKVKKLEVELWNLKVKGTDISSYTLRFQELALLCRRMFPEESDEIERYVGGLPEMIRGNVIKNNNVARAYAAGSGEKKHTDEPNIYAQNATSTMMDHVVEFQINLIPGDAPVAQEPYRLAMSEMKELSDQLQELSDKGSIRPSSSCNTHKNACRSGILYGGLFMEAPPSPDYIPGPEAPPSPDYIPGPEAPPSPDYIPGPEAPPSLNYIPGPEYPEYLPPADDVFPAEEQPLPAAASPTAESSGYIADSEPEMDPEEEDEDNEKSEGDSINYPTS